VSRRRQALLFLLVVLGELAVLGAVVAQREHLLRTGEAVRLRCRPVDPRSILSGDYVSLTYVISELDGEELRRLNRGGERFERGETVYLALRRDQGEESHHPVALSHQRRSLRGEGVLLRGTVQSAWGGHLELRYGVEDYFVPQREGERLERRLGDTVVEVAVSPSSGESAIRRLFVGGEEVRFY
jgi:uncharacterized membrane-anchored protein